ncbi:hypothetical protein K32_05270 [Kaistia sp. 32K]|uniref:hypothetical protein n=1 Tax=Kaistia sp. 32K TaxID=2795690 RepID=UPI0019164B77|nr:hypothetical protein [Kaistia sp. 32K]BCP51910.1 hypothetical protein K32_05270 [Kaistia sp. 32K]
MRYLSLFVFILLALTTAADAEISFSPRQAEIIPIVGSSYIDRALHKEFWDEFPTEFTSDPAKVAEFEAEMPKFIFAMDEYNRSLLEAAEISIRNSEPTRTERLRSAEENVVRLEPGDLTGQTNAFLKAAADGSPFEFSDGAKVISYDLIAQMISGSDSSLERSQLLYTQKWSPIPKTRELKGIRGSLASALPLNYKISKSPEDGYNSTSDHEYSLTSSDGLISITGIQNPNGDGGTLKLAYIAFKTIYNAKTMRFTFPKHSKFKGLDSVEFEYIVDVDSTAVSTSTRIIYRPSDQYFILVHSISDEKFDVVQARRTFESSLELGQ